MNRAIGDEFKFNNENFRVERSYDGCKHCYFDNGDHCYIEEDEDYTIGKFIGECAAINREDRVGVIFVKI